METDRLTEDTGMAKRRLHRLPRFDVISGWFPDLENPDMSGVSTPSQGSPPQWPMSKPALSLPLRGQFRIYTGFPILGLATAPNICRAP